MEDIYIQQYLNAEKKHWWWISRREIIFELVRKTVQGVPQNFFQRALEIGCFSGLNVRVLVPYAKTWVGIEPSHVAISEAQKYVPELEIHQGLFPEVKINGFFDAVFMLDVLEHIEDSKKALESVYAHTEPGGSFFVTVPAYQWLWTGFDDINHHYRRYTAQSLKKELQNAGFEITHITYFNTLLFLPAAIQRLLSKVMGRYTDTDTEKTGAEIPNLLLNKLFRFIFTLEKFIVPYVKFPFGLSVVAIARRPL